VRLNLRSVDLNLLPVFDAIMDAGQLSRAGEQLGMSQPALSAALQRLRTTLGDELFVRTRHGLTPTPRARELHPEIRAALDQLRHSLDPAEAFDPATSTRHFRLVGGDYGEMVVLPELLGRLRETAPAVVIQTLPTTDDNLASLAHAGADFATDALPPDDDRLEREILTRERLVVIARRDHPHLGRRLTRKRFLEAEHVVLPERDRRLPLERLLQEPGWQRRIGARVSQMAGMLAVCQNANAIGTVPESLAAKYASAFGLKVYPFPAPVQSVPVYLIWPRSLQADQAHQWMRQRLLEHGEA